MIWGKKNAKLIFGASHYLNNISKIHLLEPHNRKCYKNRDKMEKKTVLKTTRLQYTVIENKMTPNVISSTMNELENGDSTIDMYIVRELCSIMYLIYEMSCVEAHALKWNS